MANSNIIIDRAINRAERFSSYAGEDFFYADYSPAFDKILDKEGRFQADEEDSGNYCDGKLIGTKYGIAAITYKQYYKKCPTQEQMKALTVEQARVIWKTLFWDIIRGDEIKNDSIAELILDSVGGGASGFLHTRQAINKAYGKSVVAENSKSPITAAEVSLVNKLDAKKYFDVLYNIRLKYFETHPLKWKYGKGWFKRLNDVYASFKSFVGKNKNTTIAVVLISTSMILYYLYIVKSKKIA